MNISIDFVVTMVTFATSVTNIHWQLWLHEDASNFSALRAFPTLYILELVGSCKHRNVHLVP